MPTPESREITYCTAAVREILRAEPRLEPFRAPLQPQRTLSYVDATKIGSSLAGVLGASAAAAARLAWSLTRQGDRRGEAEFFVPAPACPRAIHVQEPHLKAAPTLDLKIHVYNRRCILTWGTFSTTGDTRLTPAERSARLNTNTWPDEPDADAASIASIATRILDDRLALFRIVKWDEAGMSGPVRPGVYDALLDPDTGKTVGGLEYNAEQPDEAVSEAMLHFWNGTGDAQVLPFRTARWCGRPVNE